MTEEKRIEEILTIIQKIEGSELSVREYFENGLRILNTMDIHDLDSRFVQFDV